MTTNLEIHVNESNENLTTGEYDVIVCGAGPAGLMAAITAAQNGKKVLVLERMPKAGRKLLATGGGRCNVTRRVQMSKLLRSYFDKEQFVKPALKQFPPELLIRFFENHGLRMVTSESMQVYPVSEKASDVLQCLIDIAMANSVEIKTGYNMDRMIMFGNSVCGVRCDNNITFTTRSVILAAGGMSFPEFGADGRGFTLAENAGHTIIKPVAALASLISAELWTAECAGLSISSASLYIDLPELRTQKVNGSVLFTHKGISGPAVLDISRNVSRLLLTEKNVPIRIRPLSEMTRERIDNCFIHAQQVTGNKRLRLVLSDLLPSRLVNQIMNLTDVDPEIRAADVNKATKNRFLEFFDIGIPLTIVATDNIATAMVTSGGVACNEIDAKTMESHIIKKLFFCGELVDVDGLCGGFNLQWAFSSGYLAGKSASENV